MEFFCFEGGGRASAGNGSLGDGRWARDHPWMGGGASGSWREDIIMMGKFEMPHRETRHARASFGPRLVR